MIHKIWRKAHLWLAIVTGLFLLILALTGLVLALHAVNEQQNVPLMSHAGKQKPGEFLAMIRAKHPGVSSISINKYEQLIIETMDGEMYPQRYLLHPSDASIIGVERVDSPFIRWTLSLHRSLFLNETGRFIVGIVAFLFILINISGVLLILKRNKKIRRFFKKPKGSPVAKWHVRLGQLFFIPLFITAFTGTYLFMNRFGLLPEKPPVSLSYESEWQESSTRLVSLAEFPAFQNLTLSDIRKLEFPFFDDPEEPYILSLKDRDLVIHPYNGAILQETRYPFHTLLNQLTYELHTGTTSTGWAIVLAVASLSIVGFIITGFGMTVKKLKSSQSKKKRDKKQI